MSGPKAQGVLAYTVKPATQTESASLWFLLWLDKKSSPTSSTNYWSSIDCKLTKEDHSPLDAVCRGFSVATHGLFAPGASNTHALKGALTERITAAKQALRQKIVKRVGVTLLSSSTLTIYVVPVRYIETDTLNEIVRDKGEGQWINAQQLFDTMYSRQPSFTVSVPSSTASSSSLPLYLPFTSCLRTAESLNELHQLASEFKINTEKKELNFPLTAENTETDEQKDTEPIAPLPTVNRTADIEEQLSKVELGAGEGSYACPKCRKTLFTTKDIVSHNTYENARRAFAGKFVGPQHNTEIKCTSHFINPLPSLGTFSEAEGKILCPKCTARIGNYNWSGAQCSCGEWIVPAIQISKVKVDLKLPGQHTATINATSAVQSPVRPVINIIGGTPVRAKVLPPSLVKTPLPPATAANNVPSSEQSTSQTDAVRTDNSANTETPQ